MGRLNSCFFLAALSVSCQNHTEAVAHGTDPVPPTETTPPNIILILMDDVGYSDFGCYGSEIQTPHIDWLASQGLRLRNFYNQARSAPTRASLLTGLYPHQVGYGSLKRFPGIPAYQGYVNDKNLFIPELLEEKGYMNIMTGKWHLGSDKGVTPLKRGFHRSLDMQAGGYYFYNDPDGKLNLNDESIRLDDPRLPAAWYSTDLFTTVGLEFLDEALEQQKPFFWYLAFNGAHFPLQAPPDQISKYKGKYLDGWEAVRKRRFDKQLQIGLFEDAAQLTPLNPKSPDWDTLTSSEKERYDTQMAIYASIIDVMDQNIGRIISYLEEHDILDNTLILILSDNGGNAEPGMEGRFVGPDPGAVGSIVYLGGSWADAANTPYRILPQRHGTVRLRKHQQKLLRSCDRHHADLGRAGRRRIPPIEQRGGDSAHGGAILSAVAEGEEPAQRSRHPGRTRRQQNVQTGQMEDRPGIPGREVAVVRHGEDTHRNRGSVGSISVCSELHDRGLFRQGRTNRRRDGTRRFRRRQMVFSG